MAVCVKKATCQNAGAIAAIINREIAFGYAHFGTVPVTEAEVLADLEAAKYPCVVATDQAGGVAGFAKAGPWKTRGAYEKTVEIGVYVIPASQGRGVGRMLYQTLFPLLQAAGFHSVIAGIALPNPASVALHESFGMKHVGTLPEVGLKQGAWRDVGYWHRFASNPAHA